jgi:hypothetical protein
VEPRFWDPYWTIPRFNITTKDHVTQPLGKLWPEQLAFLAAFLTHDRILVEKSRQQGLTTVASLALLWYVLTCPDGGGVIQLTHESDAIASLNEKLRVAIQSVPSRFRPQVTKDTANHIALGKCSFRQRMAGGRSQSKSFTYQHQHYTEMGSYPQGSASVNGRGVDRQVWASTNATIKQKPGFSKTVVESTAHGPHGLFHELCKVAWESPAWAFLFFSWFYTDENTAPVPDKWERTDDEDELLRLYAAEGLTDAHLVWRRQKLDDEKVDPEQFRQNYPSNRHEPFYVTGSQFFPVEVLNRLTAYADPRTDKQALVMLEEPIPGRLYFIGMDTSGGVGRDYAVVVVLRDDGKLVARWRDNRTGPHEQARIGAKLSAKYNRALTLVEANRHGASVFSEMSRLGVNLWTDAKGKPFWTQRGSIATKDRLVDLAKDLLTLGVFNPQAVATQWEEAPVRMESWLFDAVIVSQLSDMREDDKGNVTAPDDHHDDSAMAWMLAVWCARDKLRARTRAQLWTPDEARAARSRRLREMVTTGRMA